ncbi:MAG: universal stress protein [Thermodesulfobacteriota bacterium]
MIRKILISLDGSAHAAAATECGLWLSRGLDARVSGIHVVDVAALEGPFIHDLVGSLGFEPLLNSSTKMKEILTEVGRSILDSFEQDCAKAGVEVETQLITGVVTNEISERAKLSDLVIMGRKGVHERFEHGLLGSTTEGVIRKSPTPVMIVPEKFTEPRSPLIAYNGSQNAAKALHAAAEFTKTLALPLTVLTAARGDETDAILKGAEDYLKPYAVEASFARVEDEPAVGIPAYYGEKGHDLLFMGSSHHSRVVEMVLGSTAEAVTRKVEGPVFFQK